MICITNKKTNASTCNVIFSANAICKYFMEVTPIGQSLWISDPNSNTNILNDLFALEEFTLVPALQTKNSSTVTAVLSTLEDASGKYHKMIAVQPLLQLWLSPILYKCLSFVDTKYPFLNNIVSTTQEGAAHKVTMEI